MTRLMQAFVSKISGRRGAWGTLIFWLVLMVILSGVAPAAKNHAVNVNGADLPEEARSVVAREELQRHFSDNDGLPALLVFHKKDGIGSADLANITKVSEYLASSESPETVKEFPPLHLMPEPARQAFLSEDKTTLVLPVMLKDGLEMQAINDTVTQIQEKGSGLVGSSVELNITGPAGIASDTIALFSNADLVLLFSTIGLILILLIVIYRSPLLAIIPLLVAGIVHQVTDRLLGLMGKNGVFEIESQSLSIMSILLFAALTDYSLLVFARFREELKKHEDKFVAMKEAMKQVWEPVFFSAGTVLAAMLVLFIADYKPYENFAPVFSLAMGVILIAGLTLVPALFALFGRKAFWPFIPKAGDPETRTGSIWSRIGHLVVKKPGVISVLMVGVLAVGALGMTQIQYNFNLIKSFPEDLGSRKGYERLETHFSKGELAPATVLVTGTESITPEKLSALKKELERQPGVKQVTTVLEPGPGAGHASAADRGNQIISKDGKAARLQFIFEENPYDQRSLDHMDEMRNRSEDILKNSGLSPEKHRLMFAGETAKQADVRAMNREDTQKVIIWVTVLITVLLILQTRSLVAALLMISTILLSYAAAMGLSTWLFDTFFGWTDMSYRIPLYTYVFLVALGVDYNIMVVSRIREEASRHEMKEAIRRGVSLTGGVISSAGLILAATFAVLMTQPILELFMFGFTVALGILLDTFLVRSLLVPSLFTLLGRYSFWPSKTGREESEVARVTG
ncbi:MMPL family transporter [Staphylospora marina]|uniref:MMPL family transporter n=1 Tax=Staphylospora marina TaxID=2490858 RepID=UPI000F5B8C11|nr:MMPL family transporter [Staphylospora marina]